MSAKATSTASTPSVATPAPAVHTDASARSTRVRTAVDADSWTIFSRPLTRALGPRTAQAFSALGLETVGDLLFHVPFRLARRGELMPIACLREGEAVTVIARVLSATLRPMNARRGFLLSVNISDGQHELALTFFGKSRRPLEYHERRLAPGSVAAFSGKVSSYRGKLQLSHPDYELLEESCTAEVPPSSSPFFLDDDVRSSSIRARVDGEESAHTRTDGEGEGNHGSTSASVIAPPSSAVASAPAAFSRPIPIYHATEKLPSWKIQRAVASLLPSLSPEDLPDPLPASYRAEHELLGRFEALLALHQPESEQQWECARLRMIHEEAFVLQAALAVRRAESAASSVSAFFPRSEGILAAFDSSLPFDLTTGQREVGETISAELASTTPMHRLLQGDVGSGKTIVALRAMLQVIDGGGQAALLVPTEVLAHQHYETLRTLMGSLACGGELAAPQIATRVEILTGSMSLAHKRRTLARMASGEAGIIVGTHALLSEGVQIPFLGLAVIDEQHRFGVAQRDSLASGVHTLVMTATPIPRTVAMSIFGDLDVSTLTELPSGRQPVATTIVPAANSTWVERMWERAHEEVLEGGRVFVVCSKIEDSSEEDSQDSTSSVNLAYPTDTVEELTDIAEHIYAAIPTARQLQERFPDIRVGLLHGRVASEEKTETMARLISGEAPILVTTTVIEVGVDVPEATLMIILDAQRFGLSQLHQLRGRIGRGTKAGLCLVHTSALPGSLAFERVSAFASTTDGFILAERDVQLRHEGDVLGADQSGRHSHLHFLSVTSHGAIIETARQSARALVDDDPQLSTHPRLAATIARLDAERATYLEIG